MIDRDEQTVLQFAVDFSVRLNFVDLVWMIEMVIYLSIILL